MKKHKSWAFKQKIGMIILLFHDLSPLCLCGLVHAFFPSFWCQCSPGVSVVPVCVSLECIFLTRCKSSKWRLYNNITHLKVFQAVTINALLMRILTGLGPLYCEYFRPRALNIRNHRQLGLLQIRIALQEVCVSIVIIHSQIKQ